MGSIVHRIHKITADHSPSAPPCRPHIAFAGSTVSPYGHPFNRPKFRQRRALVLRCADTQAHRQSVRLKEVVDRQERELVILRHQAEEAGGESR
jgi:hypothetical protein